MIEQNTGHHPLASVFELTRVHTPNYKIKRHSSNSSSIGVQREGEYLFKTRKLFFFSKVLFGDLAVHVETGEITQQLRAFAVLLRT